MPAVIESTLYSAPGGSVVAGSTQQNSREDLQLGYQVVLHSVHEATTYSWSLSFASDSPGSSSPGFGGTESSAALLAPEGSTSRDAKFNVDFEGTYLIRLVVDAGLATEDVQFIRLRVLTLFGALKLTAAGERRDENGVIPVDATPEGWANDQNANFQKLSLLIRRFASSGRLLFVDSNRGRSSSNDQNDYDNVISLPGPDSSRVAETGMRMRAMAHGDFSSINEAITYANNAASRGEPAPSLTEPYYICVRPGLYIEDLNLVPHVHIIGEPMAEGALAPLYAGNGIGVLHHPVVIRPALAGGTGTHRFNPEGPWNTHEVRLTNLHLDNAQNTTQPVLDVQGGQVRLTSCLVSQRGDAVNQGEALRCVVSDASYSARVLLFDSVVLTTASTADRVALAFDANTGSLFAQDSVIDGGEDARGLVVNESLYAVCLSQVLGGQSKVSGAEPFRGYGSLMLFRGCEVVTTDVSNAAINVTAFGNPAGSKAGDVSLILEEVIVEEKVSFESAGAAGSASATHSGVTVRGTTGGQAIEFPNAPGDQPDSFTPLLWADSLRYVNDYSNPLQGPAASATIPSANRLGSVSVQGALDSLLLALFPVTGSPFRSLTSAYDGLVSLNPVVAGSGLGRNINAVWGAVQVQGASYPVALDNQRKNGGLQIEGMVDIGGFINGGATDLVVDVGHSEIGLIPDFTGAGPFIGLGRARWANGVTTGDRGFGSASIVAGISNSPSAPSSNAPYHLHLRTSNLRSSGTSKAGNVYVLSGGIYDTAGAHSPGDAHLSGGSTANAASTPGSVYLAPGFAGGASASGGGFVWFVGPGSTTRASLTTANPYTGGQAGVLYVGTPGGVEALTFAGTESLAAVTTLINGAARNFTATNDGTRLTLHSAYGPAGDLRIVGDSVSGALNTALGTFDAFTAGVYGDKVALDVPSNGRLRVAGAIEAQNIVVSSNLSTVTASRSITSANLQRIYSCRLTLTVDIDIELDASLPVGREIVVKDENGTASAGNQIITITDGGGGTFDGNASHTINTAYGKVVLYKNQAGNWSII